MTEQPIKIRASYLPTYPDCARRMASTALREIVEACGFKLNRRRQNIGAATGIGTHMAVAFDLDEKVKTGELANKAAAEQAGLEALGKEVEEGIIWDSEAKDLNAAQQQVLRQYYAYRTKVAPTFRPSAVERRLEAKHEATGFILSGQSDNYTLITTTEAEGRDLKTGKMERANVAQYGAYVMILRAHKIPIVRFIEDYVKRVPRPPQPDPERLEYDCDRAVAISAQILRKVKLDLDNFLKTGDPGAFLANPQSMLCNPKYCPAHGTTFCKEHKP